MVSSKPGRPRPPPRNRPLIPGLLVLLGGCTTYDSGTFLPQREVHEIRVGEAGEERTAAEVDARIVGILRPEAGTGRRLHARLVVRNPTEGELVLRSAESRVTPGSVRTIAPSNSLERVVVPAGGERTVELLFPLDDLPPDTLAEVELEWVLEVEGRIHHSHATFRRARRADAYRGPGGYRGWSYWGWGYDPFCHPYRVGFGFHHYH